jgi:hypothetical protein
VPRPQAASGTRDVGYRSDHTAGPRAQQALAEEFTRRVLAEVDEVGNCVGLIAGKWHVSVPADVEFDRFDDPLERLKPGLETQVIDKGKPHDCFGLRP